MPRTHRPYASEYRRQQFQASLETIPDRQTRAAELFNGSTRPPSQLFIVNSRARGDPPFCIAGQIGTMRLASSRRSALTARLPAINAAFALFSSELYWSTQELPATGSGSRFEDAFADSIHGELIANATSEISASRTGFMPPGLCNPDAAPEPGNR